MTKEIGYLICHVLFRKGQLLNNNLCPFLIRRKFFKDQILISRIWPYLG